MAFDVRPWPLPDSYALHTLEIDTHGSDAQGWLTVAAKASLPFQVERVFWLSDTPTNITRGGHAHYCTEELLIAVRGSIEITLEWPDGTVLKTVADDPKRGVYVPPYAWRELRYSPHAVQLVLASSDYDPAEYIRDKDTWRRIYAR